MPKFHDLSEYAATIGPVIDAVHVNVHASARKEVAGLLPGFLIDLRFTLPLRPLTRRSLATIYRYGDAASLDAEIRDHLGQGTLAEDGDGALRPTAKALTFIDGLYAVHAATTERIWAGRDLQTFADLAGRVVDAAGGDSGGELGRESGGDPSGEPGGAFAAMAPPYEPVGTPAGVLLFNRLAALRYHRADAHAAAWRAAGLTAAEIVALGPGPLRDRIERETNQRAAAPYGAITEHERALFHDGLLALV
ncbi:hypothetical protein [Nonomuraea sp. NEAU-A123]|uniref:hypothetical protein n=1 Tax=Nonomuraea sp. NEAU-A123 TaxID=2839649 RepID=UPI001BE4B9B8|nr:hypothetical protein [Nonomuraea sp. NEAU-A123]MBT2226416.1 hypothetical protein [Nonomuraea sp. NEAU-A123]